MFSLRKRIQSLPCFCKLRNRTELKKHELHFLYCKECTKRELVYEIVSYINDIEDRLFRYGLQEPHDPRKKLVQEFVRQTHV